MRLSADGSAARGGLLIGSRREKHPPVPLIDVGINEWKTAALPIPTTRRGWQAPPTLVVSSVFPLGLFRAWAYVELDSQCLVYPRPAEVGSGLDYRSSASEETTVALDQGEDFSGHRTYQFGDNMHHVDWKVVARGQGWHTKRFDAEGGDQRWLRLSLASGSDTEQRLAGLTRAVIEQDRISAVYGLDLGETQISPGTGPAQRAECLKALALFGDS